VKPKAEPVAHRRVAQGLQLALTDVPIPMEGLLSVIAAYRFR